MAEKNIIALNVKALMPSLNEIVLISCFIDVSVNEMLLHYSVVLLGYEHEQFSVGVPCNEYIDYIFTAKNEYSIDTHHSEIVDEQVGAEFHDKMVQNLVTKIEENDTGTVDYYFKRFVDHVFQSDDAKVYSSFQLISHGMLEIINAIERKQTHTVAQNTEIARKYVGSNPDLLRKVIEENQQDTIVCVYTIARNNSIIVAGALLFNTLAESLISRYTVFNQNLPPETFSISNYIVDLFHAIQSYAQSDNNVRNVSQKIDSALDSVHSERFGLILKTLDTKKIAAMLSQSLPTEYAQANISVVCEKYNSIVIESVFSPEVSRPGNTDEEEVEETDDLPEKKASIVDVDLVLAPAKGIKVSTLKPGNRIYIIINAHTALGRQVVGRLNLMEENRVKPVSGVVESVRRDAKDNYIVVTKIANNLYGKSIEEEDIKVKSGDPVVDVKKAESSKSLVAGIVIGLFIIIIAIVSFFVLT